MRRYIAAIAYEDFIWSTLIMNEYVTFVKPV